VEIEWPLTVDRHDPDLRATVRRGATWSVLNAAVSRSAQFLLGILVARIVSTYDFGVFAIALVVQAIVINVSELGVSSALVRGGREDASEIAPTVTTIALGTSTVLAATMAVGSRPLAQALGSPGARAPIAVMSLTVLLAGYSAVPSALLRREFRQDKQFIADATNTAVSGTVIVLLALAGWGPMALAWSRVAGQAASTALLLGFAPSGIRPGFRRGQVPHLLAFGLPLAGANLVSFSLLNIDYVIVGKTLGPVQLGLYLLAFNMSGWPIGLFGAVVRNVSLPAFARLRSDIPRLTSNVTSAVNIVAAVTVPVCVLLAALAEPVIQTVYGQRWSAASSALVGLGLMGASRSIIELLTDLFVALGQTRAVLVIQLLWIAGLAPSLTVGVRLAGVGGAGAAHALVAAGIAFPACVFVLRRVRMPASVVLAPLRRSVLAAIWGGLAAALTARALSHYPWAACALGGAIGAGVYAVANLKAIRIAAGSIRGVVDVQGP